MSASMASDFENRFFKEVNFVEMARLAYSITGDRESAEDIVATAMQRAFKYQHTYDPTKSKPNTWFRRIVRNCANAVLSRQITRRQHEQRFASDPDEADSLPAFAFEPVDPDPSPEAQVEEAEKQEKIREALNQLSAEKRRIVVLRFYAGLKYREIAEDLDMPIGTVKSSLSDARRILRKTLSTDPFFTRSGSRRIR